MSEQRECARRFCERTFTPKRSGQRYCSRRCAFKQLYFSRHNELWRDINDRQSERYGRAHYARRRMGSD